MLLAVRCPPFPNTNLGPKISPSPDGFAFLLELCTSGLYLNRVVMYAVRSFRSSNIENWIREWRILNGADVLTPTRVRPNLESTSRRISYLAKAGVCFRPRLKSSTQDLRQRCWFRSRWARSISAGEGLRSWRYAGEELRSRLLENRGCFSFDLEDSLTCVSAFGDSNCEFG